jgi:ATP-dependent DNA helicase RecG
MVRANNGFEIAESDLQLRGPGDLMGTQQSGALDLLISDLGKDGEVLKKARESAQKILEEDPELTQNENRVIKVQIESMTASAVNWSRIS